VTNFAGPQGFLCGADTDSHSNPITDPFTPGHPAYRTGAASGAGEIYNTIVAQGFVPLTQQLDGTFCVTTNS
jgi:hypothetical protein